MKDLLKGVVFGTMFLTASAVAFYYGITTGVIYNSTWAAVFTFLAALDCYVVYSTTDDALSLVTYEQQELYTQEMIDELVATEVARLRRLDAEQLTLEQARELIDEVTTEFLELQEEAIEVTVCEPQKGVITTKEEAINALQNGYAVVMVEHKTTVDYHTKEVVVDNYNVCEITLLISSSGIITPKYNCLQSDKPLDESMSLVVSYGKATNSMVVVWEC